MEHILWTDRHWVNVGDVPRVKRKLKLVEAKVVKGQIEIPWTNASAKLVELTFEIRPVSQLMTWLAVCRQR